MIMRSYWLCLLATPKRGRISKEDCCLRAADRSTARAARWLPREGRQHEIHVWEDPVSSEHPEQWVFLCSSECYAVNRLGESARAADGVEAVSPEFAHSLREESELIVPEEESTVHSQVHRVHDPGTEQGEGKDENWDRCTREGSQISSRVKSKAKEPAHK